LGGGSVSRGSHSCVWPWREPGSSWGTRAVDVGADRDTNTDGHANAHADSDQHADTYADCNGNADQHAHADTDRHEHAHRYSD
jgi:hypothetical protein